MQLIFKDFGLDFNFWDLRDQENAEMALVT